MDNAADVADSAVDAVQCRRRGSSELSFPSVAFTTPITHHHDPHALCSRSFVEVGLETVGLREMENWTEVPKSPESRVSRTRAEVTLLQLCSLQRSNKQEALGL